MTAETIQSMIDSTIQRNAELNEMASMLPEGSDEIEIIHRVIADNNKIRTWLLLTQE